MHVIGFVYGVVAYGLFFGWFLYAVGFVGNWVVPKSVDSGFPGPVGEALAVNVGLVALFGLQHTIMARSGFKRWLTRLVPVGLERSTFVLVAAGLAWLILWQWRPMPDVLWRVQQPAVAGLLSAVSLAGWGMVLLASFMIDHFELFGLKQAFSYLRGRPWKPATFKLTGFYRYVRHPLMTGFLIAF